ncbi:energy-coupling factor ABC transporter ATP-binding protein [Ligilactobacillus sp. WILCCON 0076]|uniref:Energy-coupling factor ABC transporter ATP-binding protein n=1 Tax=Ligilactobacillus ubinensis TaxID=2876789 RepID=A0A9X2FJ60_9LACO|nr:ABC transporter ATP-binding protein [Ligilactobacillus ubinensis]MCP0886706.1 energy-coupling factor ABC transporter ATP-binding protein [Ligilactobacillus ubinensis]
MTTTLTVKNLTFAYTDNQPPVLENINFKLALNTFNLLVGPSGCGKSTFFKLLAGLYPEYGGKITAGDILLNDVSVNNIVPFERAKYLAMLFQNPSRQFAMRTVEEQITFALENIQLDRSKIKQRVAWVLSELHLENFTKRELLTLSGGEQQRVALATILALDSQIILLDEPFANVDPVARKQLLHDLKKLQLKHHKTIFITDHDFSNYTGLVDNLYKIENKQLTKGSTKILDKIIFSKQTQQNFGSLHNLTWNNLSLSIHDKILLQPNTLYLPKGQVGLLSGANGVGKSTFFGALTHQTTYEGDIFYQQKLSTKYKRKAWAQIIGLVFQNSTDQFVRLTIAEELNLSKKHSLHPEYWTDSRINDAYQLLNLTNLSKQHIVYQLSGGQQRKLQVLSMLIMAQPVLLLDEPLASLDSTSLNNVLQLIIEVTQALQLSTLIISHQLVEVRPQIDYELEITDKTLHLRRTTNET